MHGPHWARSPPLFTAVKLAGGACLTLCHRSLRGPTLVLIELTTTLGRRQPILRLIGYGLAAWRYLIGWVLTIPMMT